MPILGFHADVNIVIDYVENVKNEPDKVNVSFAAGIRADVTERALFISLSDDSDTTTLLFLAFDGLFKEMFAASIQANAAQALRSLLMTFDTADPGPPFCLS